MTIRRIPVAQYQAALLCQRVSAREHFAFKCPLCGTVQSAQDFIDAGVGIDFARVERFVAFSCIGRFTGAGPFHHKNPPQRGCDWTLGGLFQLHKLEVLMPDGAVQRSFEIAHPDEAQAHERRWRARQAQKIAS